MNKLFQQMIRFGFVGGFCFVLDFLTMVLLTEKFGINYLVSCCISTSISIVVNYILSMRFVFASRKDLHKSVEFGVYAILSLIGLGLTEILMWMGVDLLHFYYMLTKVFVTGIVMVYNFVSRKFFLEGNRG